MNKLATLTAVMMLVAPVAVAQDQTPSGTITFSGGAIAIGVGYSWGGGILDFQGKKCRFSMDGLSIVDIGAASIEGTGEVYNLKRAQQFAGNYVAAGIGATIVGGGSLVALTNQNGVVIHVHSMQEGLKFNLSASGVSVELKGID
jgi:hypothetical protein